jgi:hypothetical protein
MKRMLLIAAGLALSVALSACNPTQQAQVLTVAQQVNTQISKACAVYSPVSADIEALYPTVADPKVAAGLAAVSGLCGANASIDVASLQSISQTTIPAAIKGLATAGLSAADQTKVGNLLTAVNIFVAAAYAVYGTPVVAPASAASATQ